MLTALPALTPLSPQHEINKSNQKSEEGENIETERSGLNTNNSSDNKNPDRNIGPPRPVLTLVQK